MFLELKRLRLICLLTQGDVSIETGIPARRLSLAERGLVQLSEAENVFYAGYLVGGWCYSKAARPQAQNGKMGMNYEQ